MTPFLKTDHRVKITVSMRETLRRRMHEYQTEVNWSAVACVVFESVLRDIEASNKESLHDRVMDGLGKTLGQFTKRNHQTAYSQRPPERASVPNVQIEV